MADLSSSVTSAANSSTSSANSTSTANSKSGQDPTLYNQYLNQYNSYLGFHNDNYQNILDSYLGTPGSSTKPATPGILGNISGISQQIKGGYDQLGSSVQAQIQGTGLANQQDIAAQYAAQRGQSDQNLVSAGLGNTTVRSAAQRGLTLDESRAQTANSNQIAQLAAGYQSQIGQAGLGEQQQAMNVIGSLGSQYLQTLGGQRLDSPTWSPNQTTSSSNALSTSSSAAQGSSVSSSASLPQDFSGAPPAGLNAGGSDRYSPGAASGVALNNLRNLRVPTGIPSLGGAGFNSFTGGLRTVGNQTTYTSPVTGAKVNVGSTAGGSGLNIIGGQTYVNGVHVSGSGALLQGSVYASSPYAGAVTASNLYQNPSPFSSYNPAYYNAYQHSVQVGGFGPTLGTGGPGSPLG